MSLLFSLDPELRERIWEAVLLSGPSDVQLLRTCRQIHEETTPIVLGKPLIFMSQGELFAWLEQVHDRDLTRVSTVTLYLQDLEVLALEDDLSWPNVSLLESYQLEGDKVLSMLSRLLGITSLNLYQPNTIRSHLYHKFYSSVLKKIGLQFPTLRALSFHSDDHRVDFLKSFSNLRRLRFTGYSKSSSMETLNALSRLRHLDTLHLIPPETPKVLAGFDIGYGLPKTICMTRDVIRGMGRLTSLTIQELHVPHEKPAFLTASFFQAIDSRHRMSLQSLCISGNFMPDMKAQRALQVLLQSSSIRHIDVIWPKMDDKILKALPRTTETLRIPAVFGQPLHWVLMELQIRKLELPQLRTIRLVSDSESSKLSLQVCVL